MQEGAVSSPRRRLPTKASSGRIVLPSSQASSNGSSETSEIVESVGISSISGSQSPIGSSPICEERPAVQDSTSNAESLPCLQARPVSYGPPRTVPKPPPLKTGPLNATSTPQAQALPVKRRGSYQSLKRHAPGGINSESEPSVIGLIKKATHWERFGTILVLGCLSKDSADGDSVLQMLQAEGYDTSVAETYDAAVVSFGAREVFPDVVLVDADHVAFNTTQLIRQLQSQNPTVAILCIGGRGAKLDAVSALQTGAADFMYKPIDLDEMVARIERHVQRQHCIKLELEKAMEDAKAMMAQLGAATALGDMLFSRGRTSHSGNSRLIAVDETDFEQQITDLSEENHKLDTKLQEMENKLMSKDHENRMLADKLNQLEVRVSADSNGVQGQLHIVAEQNNALMHKVDALERMVRHSHELPNTCQQGPAPGV